MSEKVELIKISELKEHKKASDLVPEMNTDEWGEFKENIKTHGVRQPIHINMKNEVLDGRHRFYACRDLGIEEIQAMRHDLAEDEEMMFVRDTAIERRNLAPAQKHKVFTDAEDLIKSIYEKGRQLTKEGGKEGRKSRWGNNDGLGSIDPKPKPHNTSKEIGDAIGVSMATVKRLNKVKREAPELYEEVIEGEKTASGAYNELPTVKKRVSNNKKTERADASVKTEVKADEQAHSKMTESEVKKEMFNANVSTFFRHLSEIEGFVGRTEDFNEVVNESINRDSASMQDYKDALNKIIKLMEAS